MVHGFGLPASVVDAVFLALLVVCALTDLLRSKVYNVVTLPAVGLGVILNFAATGLHGVRTSLVGLAVGFGLLFLVFMFGGMGGGDVKLMAAIGSLKGYPFILWAVFFSALTGGVLAVGVLLYHGRLLRSLRNVGRVTMSFLLPFLKTEPLDPTESQAVPFAFAISLGSFWCWLLFLAGRL